MTWQPINFQGIACFDQPLLDQLATYLEEKEHFLGQTILEVICTGLGDTLPKSTSLKEAVELFKKEIKKAPEVDWKSSTQLIETALWEYVEVLEGCVTELFQQLDLIGFEEWHTDLAEVLKKIKKELLGRIETLIKAIEKIEEALYQLKMKRLESVFWLKRFWLSRKAVLDSNLIPYLKNTKQFLNLSYTKFIDKHSRFIEMDGKIKLSLLKFKRYHVFSTLDEDFQFAIKKVYYLLKLWHLNEKKLFLPFKDPVRVLRHLFSLDKVTALFKEYHKGLKRALYERSRGFKKNVSEIFSSNQGKKIIEEAIKSHRNEIHTLGAMMLSYRDFILRTDPNPYVSSRWGFTEWIVGPEPKKTKDLLSLSYDVQQLDDLFEVLNRSLKERNLSRETVKFEKLKKEINKVLHEIGQPLTSQSILEGHAEKLIEMLEELNELGSFQQEVVGFMAETLTRALRADWQYHVLHDFSSFEKVFKIHQGIAGAVDDRHHLNRVNKFKELLDEMAGWVTKHQAARFLHEIEMDMNDIKGYLQDFLGYVQNLVKSDLSQEEKEQKTKEVHQQILEYRYLFGQFFSVLRRHERETKSIRNQFLFVDHYLESAENLCTQ